MDQEFRGGRISSVRVRHAVTSLPVPQRLDLDPVACRESRASEAEAFMQAADIDGRGRIAPGRDAAHRSEIIRRRRGVLDGRERDEHKACRDQALDRPLGPEQRQPASRPEVDGVNRPVGRSALGTGSGSRVRRPKRDLCPAMAAATARTASTLPKRVAAPEGAAIPQPNKCPIRSASRAGPIQGREDQSQEPAKSPAPAPAEERTWTAC